MQANTATKFLPIVSDEKKIDISLSDTDAIIKLSTWTEDLGWTCQKTLEVDAGMLDELHHIITAARYKLNKQKSTNNKAKSSNIIDFPCVS
ncbi:MAG: hypothetical protein M3405_02760 [Acidobacteriota bacterium]|jgi:predicted DCC family thiol-disulfide oxidoreductase YuxK|nr:hypothetical protein [Acidobacteriota bacterium]